RQLVLADARRPAAPGDRRHGAGVPRRPPAMCPLPPPPLRALEPGRLLRALGFLHAAGSQELWRAAAVLRCRQRHRRREGPAHRQDAGTEIPRRPGGKFTPEEDPRHALVDWMAKPDNPFFAKALVNRLWGHFLGRGLCHEVDDMRESNPPSNPELLDALAKDFTEHKFDVKYVIRTILNSHVYQLSSEPTEATGMDEQTCAGYYAGGMPAEVFFDAVNQATGTKANFSGVAAGARAVDLPHEGFGSYFLDTFDRPRRVTGCECERSSGATLAQ